MPGILNWAVRGCIQWQRHGLRPPDAVVAATERYRRDQDVIGHFLADTCTTNAVLKVRSAHLYDAYKAWCGGEGIKYPISQRALAPALEERGYQRDEGRNGRKWWTGIGLLAAENEKPS